MFTSEQTLGESTLDGLLFLLLERSIRVDTVAMETTEKAIDDKIVFSDIALDMSMRVGWFLDSSLRIILCDPLTILHLDCCCF